MENIRLIDVNSIDDGETVINQKDIPNDLKQSLESLYLPKVKGAILGDQSIKFKEKVENIRIVYGGSNEVPQIQHIAPNFVAEHSAKEYNSIKSTNNSGGGGSGMSELERRVQNLESETQRMRHQLEDIRIQNIELSHKLDNVATKSQLNDMKNDITNSILAAIKPLPSTVEVKNIIHEVNKEDNIATTSDVKLIVANELKEVPKTNDIKAVLDTTISEKKLTSETAVENILMKSQRKVVVWVVGTGLTCVGLAFTYAKFFM
ncbi:hypothetical protein [Priestia flexa]|uniref:hypothetical protein n=1 Tax=Priestia flexa TaxID=86664 RepID=UPI0013D20B26|nr:hypothetical protein [Priestia flexa]